MTNLSAVLVLALSAGLSAGEVGPASVPAEKTPEKAEPVAEDIVRQRFLLAYQTAQNPDRKAETVDMLKGLKEQESMRLMVGLLADRSEQIRRRVCTVMAATPDPEGYFVKPLMGTLSDPVSAVRVSAAEALGNASMKADALKALAFTLLGLVGQLNNEGLERQAPVIDAYDKALEKLSGQRCADRTPRGLSSFWIDVWKKQDKDRRAAENKPIDTPDPVRSPNLPKDSLDKK
ncbi:MAG TPA: HEAT repeat domain-containing protein [Planctomycetota bacterium]